MESASWPHFEEDEIQAAINVLRSGHVNQWTGQEVRLFEKEFANYIGVKYAIALANGSLALDLALIVLAIGPGDEVIVSPRSFFASAGCIALRGATPVFVDVDPESQNITVENVKTAWTPETKAVIAVHLAGWPCELDGLRSFCDEKDIFLIEDCAQAHGAKYKNRKIGSYGDFAAFSFCQDKIMTTGGEGGMLLTNNHEFWEKAWSYKDHGKDYDSVFSGKNGEGFRWLAKGLGTNYRMTEVQAAIGRMQLGKLDGWVSQRRKLAGIMNQSFLSLENMRTTIPTTDYEHAYYKYYVFVRPEGLARGWSRERIISEISSENIACGVGSCPLICCEKAFIDYGYKIIGNLSVAKDLGETALMFQVHPTLNESDVEATALAIKKIFVRCRR